MPEIPALSRIKNINLMGAKITDGKLIAEKILLDLKNKIAKLSKKPGLAAILISDDPPSKLYIKIKERTCQKIGINFHKYFCNSDYFEDISENQILEMIDFLNSDPAIDGIIVQLPLPKKFNTEKVIERISPPKDIDGFHPKNLEKFLAGKSEIIPPLIDAILEVLKNTGENLAGKTAIVLDDSPVFSAAIKKALADLKIKAKTIKSDDFDLTNKTLNADILISIIGQPYFIKKTMVKKDAIVIDCGTTLVAGKTLGDIDPKVSKVTSFFTPVPGGIGPITVAMLLKNTYELSLKNQ